jgi:hypothetical protein
MAIVRSTLTDGSELTPEQHAKIEAELREAAKRHYTYDPDCPMHKKKQLAEFRPINGMTWEDRAALMEERARAMKQEAPALANG